MKSLSALGSQSASAYCIQNATSNVIIVDITGV